MGPLSGGTLGADVSTTVNIDYGGVTWVGTDFALTGSYTWTAFLASLIPFFLVSNLLLLNQFPDVEADRSIGSCNCDRYGQLPGNPNRYT